jgi:hypothetical protein
MQRYRSPAIELYGAIGVLQLLRATGVLLLLGDDWAPDGFEQWTNDRGSWELFGERDPHWPWADGLRHLVDCVDNAHRRSPAPSTRTTPLEVTLAAKQSAAESRVIEVTSPFPELHYSTPASSESTRPVDDSRTP